MENTKKHHSTEVTLTGALGWLVKYCFLVTGAAIVIAGTYVIIQHILVEILIAYALRLTKCWKPFVEFMWYRKQIFQWLKDTENKDEQNDE